MLDQGRSLSGNERNCCYLNPGASPQAAGRFANISAGSGLDYPDDGRGLAVLDWDHDGDLDLWFSNRNAPRLRLMRNDTPTRNHWVALQLVGNGETTNRDAIGARVEVITRAEGRATREEDGQPPPPDARPLIKTLRAGEGFLSQSSKWVHVGLGQHDRIEKVVVRWPTRADSVQEFTGLEVDQRYRLVQGREKVETVAPRPVAVNLTPSRPELPPASSTARIPVVTLVKPPQWQFQDVSGRQLSIGTGRPVLVMLWASWCKPCLKEIAELRGRAEEIRQAGIEVVALSVDGLGDDGSDPEAARAMLAGLEFPFVNALASRRHTRRIVADMQSLHDSLVRLDRPLPVPSSFLIDANGNVSVIYRGRLSVDDLLADVGHTQGSLLERWVRAAPLPGRTIQHKNALRTRRTIEAALYYRIAAAEFAAGVTDAVLYYLNQSLRFDSDSDHVHQLLGECFLVRGGLAAAEHHYRQATTLNPNEPVNNFGLACINMRLGKTDEALRGFAATISLDPKLTDAYRQRARAYLAVGNHKLALEDCTKAIELEPQVAEAHILRGKVYKQLGKHGLALREFEHAVQLKPDHASACYNLAWHLATCADARYRNGRRAITIAIQACELLQWKHYGALGALAAARAENGQFNEATGWQTKAIELAPEAARPRLRSRLDLYRTGKPYHESQE